MVIDNITNCERYSQMHPLFEQAFEFLESEAADLEDGRYELDGDALFVTLTHCTLKEQKDAKLEAHNNYIDIQMILEGAEGFGYTPRCRCDAPAGEFNCEKDIIFYTNEIESVVRLEKGEFAIFFPNDGHAPLIGDGQSRKAIVKVKVQ